MKKLSLYTVPGLERLKEIADAHGVGLSVIGSVPRRLLLASVSRVPFARHLIDLVPFTSDIDLVHEGEPSQTPAITRDIAYTLPFAELFRWQVSSRQERRQYDAFLAASAHVVPDNLLTLDDGGLHDPYNAAEDYARSQLRFELNERYAQSELFHQGRDLPIFAALLWLRNALQAAPYLDGFDVLAQLAIANVAEAVRATEMSPTFQSSLAGSGYLKSRLVYLFTAMSTSSRSEAEYTALLRATGIDKFAGRLYKVDEETAVRVETSMGAARMRTSSLVSATVGNAAFRTPPACRRWDVAEIAQAALLRVLGDEKAAHSSDVALLASEPIPLSEGNASCSKGVEGEVHEFFHAHIPLSAELARTVVEFPDTDLAVAISICRRVHNEWSDIPGAVLVLPAVCSYRYDERREGSALQIRVNVFGVFSEIHRIFKERGFDMPPGMRLFVIRPLGFGQTLRDPESDAIWREGNETLVRRSRPELAIA